MDTLPFTEVLSDSRIRPTNTTTNPDVVLISIRPEINYQFTLPLRKYHGCVVDTRENIFLVKQNSVYHFSCPNDFYIYENQRSIDMNQQNVKLNESKICYAFEGPIVSIWKYNNTIYFSTRRKIDTENSRWVSGKTYRKMWADLGGLELDKFFSPTCISSPFVYSFLINHRDMANCSRRIFNDDGKIFFLGVKDMRDDVKYRSYFNEHREIFEHEMFVNLNNFIALPDVRDNSIQFENVELNPQGTIIERANQLLKQGERIIIVDNSQQSVHCITPPDFMKREDLHEGMPNYNMIFSRFFIESAGNGGTISDCLDRFDQIFIFILETFPRHLHPIINETKSKFIRFIATSDEWFMINSQEILTRTDIDVPNYVQELANHFQQNGTVFDKLLQLRISNTENINKLNSLIKIRRFHAEYNSFRVITQH